VHRGYYGKFHSKPIEATVKQREENLVSKISGVLGLTGFLALAACAIKPAWLVFADLSFPAWLRWIGIGISMFGFGLLQWAQVTLANNWSDTPRMMKDQVLITNGPYRFIRHPIYTAFILILGSLLFVSSNWLIGFCWSGMVILEVFSRIKFEESLMVEYFGKDYSEYMKKTGKIFPRVI